MKVLSTKPTILFIALSLLISSLSIAQNIIYKGEKSYPSTDSWEFKLNSEASHDASLLISVAKISHTSGFLSLSVTGFFFEQSTITGPVMIYLYNGKVLTILNRISHDNVDRSITSLFSLNDMQLKQLANYNISRIRFSASGDNFSADNIYTSEYVDPNGFRSTITNTNPTAADIKELFNY